MYPFHLNLNVNQFWDISFDILSYKKGYENDQGINGRGGDYHMHIAIYCITKMPLSLWPPPLLREMIMDSEEIKV